MTEGEAGIQRDRAFDQRARLRMPAEHAEQPGEPDMGARRMRLELERAAQQRFCRAELVVGHMEVREIVDDREVPRLDLHRSLQGLDRARAVAGRLGGGREAVPDSRRPRH